MKSANNYLSKDEISLDYVAFKKESHPIWPTTQLRQNSLVQSQDY